MLDDAFKLTIDTIFGKVTDNECLYPVPNYEDSFNMWE